MTVLVVGATGRVGGRVVRRLAERGAPVRALVRDRARAGGLPARAEVAVGDLADPASLRAAFDGVARVFLVCVPDPAPARLALHDAAVRAARRAGVEQLVYQSFLNAAPDAGFPQGRWHARTEESLRRAGVPHTVLRAGLFQSSLLTTAGILVGDRLLAPAGDGRIAPVAWQDLADVAAAVLTAPGHLGRTYDVTGPELLDWAGVAAAVGGATGRPLRHEEVEPAEFARRLAGTGVPAAVVEGMVGLFADVRAGRTAVRTDVVRDVGGAAPVRLAEGLTATATGAGGTGPPGR